jgi:hypothetical protein
MTPRRGAPPPAGACLEGATECDDTGGMGTDAGDGMGDEMPAANLVEPRPGMDNVQPVDWDHAEVEGDQTVTVSWWSGVEPCHVLDRVEVDYTDEAVIITVFEGSEPSDEGHMCIEIAERRGTVIELDEPLGPRSLKDGRRVLIHPGRCESRSKM